MDVYITHNEEGAIIGLTEVIGDLYIRRPNVEFPDLKRVGGAIHVQAKGLSFPVLEYVGRLEDSVGMEFPALRSMRRMGETTAPSYDHWNKVSSPGTSLPALETIADLPLPEAAVAAELIKQVAVEALKDDESLDMLDWHTCESVHCISGWAVHLSGPAGCALEDQVGSYSAGALLLGLEAAGYFYATRDAATGWLTKQIEEA